MKSQVLHTVWCHISGVAAGEIWTWSLLGVKRLSPMHNVPKIAYSTNNTKCILQLRKGRDYFKSGMHWFGFEKKCCDFIRILHGCNHVWVRSSIRLWFSCQELPHPSPPPELVTAISFMLLRFFFTPSKLNYVYWKSRRPTGKQIYR